MAYVPVPKDFSKIKDKFSTEFKLKDKLYVFLWQEFVVFRSIC